jgi:hypothetical protein
MVQKLYDIIIVSTWRDMEIKAKELVDSGFTKVFPSDKPDIYNFPGKPMIGFVFEKSPEEKAVWLQISLLDLKHSRPEHIAIAMQSELGKINIAKSWGNYLPPPENPDAKKLTWEETERIMKQAEQNYNKQGE